MTRCRSRGEIGGARHRPVQRKSKGTNSFNAVFGAWFVARVFSHPFAPETQFAGLREVEGPLQGTNPLPRSGGLRRELSRTARLSIALMRE